MTEGHANHVSRPATAATPCSSSLDSQATGPVNNAEGEWQFAISSSSAEQPISACCGGKTAVSHRCIALLLRIDHHAGDSYVWDIRLSSIAWYAAALITFFQVKDWSYWPWSLSFRIAQVALLVALIPAELHMAVASPMLLCARSAQVKLVRTGRRGVVGAFRCLERRSQSLPAHLYLPQTLQMLDQDR